MRNKERKAEENGVLDAIGQYLSYKKDVYFFRVNNTGVFDQKKNIFRKTPKYAVKGVPDLMALKGGRVYFIECKSQTGTLSEGQRLFKANAERCGAVYITARSVNDVMVYL